MSDFEDDDEFERTHARNDDPDTSHEAAASMSLSAKAQAYRLLEVFAKAGVPLTDEEAFYRTTLSPDSCWWHRCSDLRKDRTIQWAYDADGQPIKRDGKSGRARRASIVTEAGLAECRRLGKAE